MSSSNCCFQPRQHIKSRDNTLPTKIHLVKDYGFSSSHVWMWKLNSKESWGPKNWCFWTVVLEKTLESPLDCKEIQPVHSKRNRSRISIGRTDTEAETPILWLPDVKIWLIEKEPDAGKDWTLEWVAISFSNAWKWKVKVKSLSLVRPSATPWTVAFQAPLSMEFSRQEYWSGVPLPSPKGSVRRCNWSRHIDSTKKYFFMKGHS